MYADRHARARPNPASLGIAVLINAGAVGALLLASPTITQVWHKPDLKTFIVPPDRVPDPVPPPPQPSAKPLPRQAIDTTTPPISTRSDFTVAEQPPTPATPAAQPEGTGADPGPITAAVVDPPKPAPVVTIPSVDARYARDLQPTYPPEERRAGRNGRVVVRVLVGVDGRVKQVERVSATSDAFYQVTQERALARWRFKPATRDGIPIEAWRLMALSFVLEDE